MFCNKIESVGDFNIVFNNEILSPLLYDSVYDYKDIFIVSVTSQQDGSIAYGKINQQGFKRELRMIETDEEITHASKLNFNAMIKFKNGKELAFELEWENPSQVSREQTWDLLKITIIKPEAFRSKNSYKTIKLKEDCQ